MYEAYFNFTEAPFKLTPDARYFYASARHKRALDCLKFGLSHGEGFVVVTGDVGTGKTTLIGHLLATLPQARFVPAAVVSTQVGADDLLHMVAESFGLPHDGATKSAVLTRLQRHFEQLSVNDALPLIIVDEAQNLPGESLEELRMLSNSRFGKQSSPLTLLIGQPQFRDKMADPDLLQLRQRVVASYHLGPLAADETSHYVQHRLNTVGWSGNPAIGEGVFAAVHEATGGVPRLINLLFSRALLLVYLDERKELTAQDVDMVAEDMRREHEQISMPPKHKSASVKTRASKTPLG
jgi:general secretion pathway protein A